MFFYQSKGKKKRQKLLLLFTLTFTTDLVIKTKSRQTKCRCHLKQSVLSGRTFNVGNSGAQIQTVSSQNKKEKKTTQNVIL